MVLKFLCKIGENTAVFAIFFGNCLQIFETFPASGGLRPPDPLRGRTPYLQPPEIFSCVRHCADVVWVNNESSHTTKRRLLQGEKMEFSSIFFAKNHGNSLRWYHEFCLNIFGLLSHFVWFLERSKIQIEGTLG